jgi:hypothetical protein
MLSLANDRRLANQASYLSGVTLHWAQWHRPRLEWDHDHCAFCWDKFMEEETSDVLHAGYTTADEYYWICPTCFQDFKEQFGWQLAVVE